MPAGLPGECPGGPGGAAQAPRLPSTAAGARPGGCATPGSEAWRGFCTSGPTISQVRGLGYPGGRREEAGGLGRVYVGACGKGGSGAPPFAWLVVTLTENGFHLLPGLNPSLCPLLELASAGDGSRLRTFLRVGSAPDHFFPGVIILNFLLWLP